MKTNNLITAHLIFSYLSVVLSWGRGQSSRSEEETCYKKFLVLAYENAGEWVLIASSQLMEKTNCVSAEQNWTRVEKQYPLKSTINCTVNPPAFKQACNIINLLFLLVPKVLNSPVVSNIQRYCLNSTLGYKLPASEQVRLISGSKYKPTNGATSLLVQLS